MTTKSIPALLASLLLTVGVLSAAAAKTDAEIIAAARKAYPLKTCLVSNEPLGSMGEASGYIYRAKGQPDRVVYFCCEGCGDDFKANPAKFLAKVDDAAAQAAKSGKKG
jgi:YHS domain-containing protein